MELMNITANQLAAAVDKVMPEVILQPGEVERWRFIHAGVRKNVKLALLDPCSGDRLPLVQVAADGIPSTTKRLSDDNSVLMAPGYRSDVMLKVRRRGTYYLVDEEVGPVVLGAQYCFLNPENQQFSLDGSAQNILARVVVRGARQYDRFPANAELLCELAHVYRDAGNYNHALRYYEKSIAINVGWSYRERDSSDTIVLLILESPISIPK